MHRRTQYLPCIFIIILYGISFFSCHTVPEKKHEEKVFALMSDKPGMFINIENSGDKEACFNIKFNNSNFNSESEILEKIKNMPEEFPNEPLERKAWRFVSYIINRSRPITGERWQHSPMLMINSIGFGQCDDYASVLNFIWRKQGFKSRIWGLEGHVVPEVFVNNDWHMYDANLGLYYINAKNEVAGVEDLSSNPELFTNPFFDKSINQNDSLDFFSVIRYSGLFAKRYQSRNDNKVNDWYDVSVELENAEICLPPDATLEFPVKNPNKIYIKGFFGEENDLQCFMKIILPEKWVGKITLPFVITSVNGKGEVELNGIDYRIEDDSLNLFLKKFTTFNNSLSFKKNLKKIEIFCLLNPEIFKISGNDTLRLHGTNIDGVSASILQGNFIESFSANSEKEKKIGKLIQIYVSYYKKNQTELDSILFNPILPLKNKNDLIRNIKLFFKNMDILEKKERKKRTDLLIRKTEYFYQMVSGNKGKGQFLKLIADPITFIMFVSVIEVCNEEEMVKIFNEKSFAIN